MDSFNKILLSAYYDLGLGLSRLCGKYKDEIRHIPLEVEWNRYDLILV